jgi:hypothetical protein
MTKPKTRTLPGGILRHSGFGFLSLFWLRHSGFPPLPLIPLNPPLQSADS